jgi:hypothetical protein
MVPDPRFTVLGLEYFCNEKDALWSSSDEQLIDLAKDELATLGLADKSKVVDGAVVRQPKAYPLYDHDYRANVAKVREFLAIEAPNLQVAGRNGMHKYDNQDHAMMTGLMAARNIMGASFDLWRVNSDAEYLESEDSVTGDGRRDPNPADDKGEVWGIPALDLISIRSGYIGALGILLPPLVPDLFRDQLFDRCRCGSLRSSQGCRNAAVVAASVDRACRRRRLLSDQHRSDHGAGAITPWQTDLEPDYRGRSNLAVGVYSAASARDATPPYSSRTR